MVTSIMIVGVGGQGSLLASKLLGRAAMDKGYDVKVSEVHGMSQRGGSVVTYVKFGDKVNSPIIDKGEADYIISFELLEAARYVQFLKPGGQIVTNSQQIDPMPVIAGTAEYPTDLIEKMEAAGTYLYAILLLQNMTHKNHHTVPVSNVLQNSQLLKESLFLLLLQQLLFYLFLCCIQTTLIQQAHH